MLAQISRNDRAMYRVTGDILMVHVFELIHAAHNIIGGRFVFLDCDIEHPKLIEKYKEYGFVFLQNRVNEGNKKTFAQMFQTLPIKFEPSTYVKELLEV